MKKLLFTALLLGLVTSNIWAQQNDSVYLEQSNQQDNYLPQLIEGDNFVSTFSQLPFISVLQQIAVDVNQVGRINLEGNDNKAALNQKGTNNIGAIIIKGNNNTTSLNQSGIGLLSVLNIHGNANDMDINQTGQSLQNYIQVTGNGIEMDIAQNRNGIRLMQQGGNAIPLDIKSQGQSIPLIIRNN